jgi:hypothetical protein
MTEHQLQSACVEWFGWKYPKLIGFYFAIPNGMWSKNIHAALKCRREGMIRGVPDTFLMLPKNGYHGFWIEFKIGSNKLTPEQAAFKFNAITSGFNYSSVYTVEQFEQEVSNYLNDK